MSYKQITLPQVAHLLRLVNNQKLTSEQLGWLFDSGILADVLEATKVDGHVKRNLVRRALMLHPLLHLEGTGWTTLVDHPFEGNLTVKFCKAGHHELRTATTPFFISETLRSGGFTPSSQLLPFLGEVLQQQKLQHDIWIMTSERSFHHQVDLVPNFTRFDRKSDKWVKNELCGPCNSATELWPPKEEVLLVNLTL